VTHWLVFVLTIGDDDLRGIPCRHRGWSLTGGGGQGQGASVGVLDPTGLVVSLVRFSLLMSGENKLHDWLACSNVALEYNAGVRSEAKAKQITLGSILENIY
jgi:hypothetical protein